MTRQHEGLLAGKVASTVGLAELVLVRRVADGVEPLASKYLPLATLRPGRWMDRDSGRKRRPAARRPGHGEAAAMSFVRRGAMTARSRRAAPACATCWRRCALRRARSSSSRSSRPPRRGGASKARSTCRRLPPRRSRSRKALGRVLAVDVAATTDVPAFDRSGVDGFAVRAADTAGRRRAHAPSAACSMPR